MNDSHVLEEMRSMRGTHGELLGEMRELCGSVRELTIQLGHTQKNFDSLDVRMGRAETDIRSLQLDAALNKPILDVVKALNTKMLVTIGSTVLAIAGMNVDWSKFIGG